MAFNPKLKTMEHLDDTDIKILEILQEDCRLTNKEIAAKVNLSSTPVFERIKRLEKAGYIKKYVAVLDNEKLHRGFVVYCYLKFKQLNTQIAKEFTNAIMAMEEIAECYNISGEFDYMLKIQAPDMNYYRRFLIDTIGKFEYVGSIHSVFVMDRIKHTYGVGLGKENK